MQEGEETANHILAAERHSPKSPHLLFLILSLVPALQALDIKERELAQESTKEELVNVITQKTISVLRSRLMEADIHSKICFRYRLA